MTLYSVKIQCKIYSVICPEIEKMLVDVKYMYEGTLGRVKSGRRDKHKLCLILTNIYIYC